LNKMEDSKETNGDKSENAINSEKNLKSNDLNEETQVEEPKKDDRALFIGVVVIILLLGSIFGIRFFLKDYGPKTMEEMHDLNLDGELKESQGYVYNGFSFINVSGFWYTEMKSPTGKTLYSIDFRYGPKQVEEVEMFGNFDVDFFNNATEAYVTFNPEGFEEFTYLTVAVGDLDQHLIKVFKKMPIAACDRNETKECVERPIVDCSSEGLVFYFVQDDEASVEFKDNCILIKGKEEEVVRAVDKLLLKFYNII